MEISAGGPSVLVEKALGTNSSKFTARRLRGILGQEESGGRNGKGWVACGEQTGPEGGAG